MEEQQLQGLVAGNRLALLALLALSLLSACASHPAKTTSNNKQVPAPASIEPSHFIAQVDIPEIIEDTTADSVARVYPSFSVSLSGVPVREFLQALARDAGVELVTGGNITGTVSMVMNDRPLPETLDNLVSQASISLPAG